MTSEGVFVFLDEALRDAGIDPKSGQTFTLKLTGVSALKTTKTKISLLCNITGPSFIHGCVALHRTMYCAVFHLSSVIFHCVPFFLIYTLSCMSYDVYFEVCTSYILVCGLVAINIAVMYRPFSFYHVFLVYDTWYRLLLWCAAQK